MEAQPSAAPAQAPDAAADEHLNHPTNVKIREATACKEKGTEHFTAGAYQDAVEAYVEGAAIAGTVEGAYRSKVAQDLRTACLCNAAQARLKEQKWTDAVDLCSQAVTIDARCVKALFRRGCARLELKQYDDARSDLAAALEVEPQNKAVKNKVCAPRAIAPQWAAASDTRAHALHLVSRSLARSARPQLVDAERTQMEEAKRSKGMNNYDRFAKIDLSDDEQEATDTSTPPPPTAPPTAPPPATKQRSPPAAAAKPTPAAAPQEGTDGETSAYEKKPGTGYRYWANAPSAPRVIPKKIDPSEAPQLGQQDSGGGSVWNKAGTCARERARACRRRATPHRAARWLGARCAVRL